LTLHALNGRAAPFVDGLAIAGVFGAPMSRPHS
jgi:hypothetical protein